MKLISRVSGKEITEGRTLHGHSGPAAPHAWRFERISLHRDGVHRVHVSRPGGRVGRIHRAFHPSDFGCEVRLEITWRRTVRHAVTRTWSKVDDYLLAGLFALVPLAFFEPYHWLDVVSMLGLDGK
ncbi:hypothetical protein [Streptomyces sp. NPDC003483]